MQQFLEYLGHHPVLAAAAAITLVVVLAYEVLTNAQAAGALSTMQAVRLMNQGALLIDVRAGAAYAAGHIAEARSIPSAELAAQAESLQRWRERTVIVYCDTGRESAAAVRTLAKLGFTKAVSLDGGLTSWLKDNLPVTRQSGGGSVAT